MADKLNLTYQSLTKKYPNIVNYSCHDLNKEILEYLKLFVDDENVLIAALIQNPLNKKRLSKKISLFFNPEVYNYLQTLNRLQETDFTIFNNYSTNRKVIILFLANYKLIFDFKDTQPEFKKILNKKKVAYAMELLKRNDISELRADLEDKFFSLLDPKIFKHYSTLLQFTKETYFKRDKEIKDHFRELLKEEGVKSEIKTRLKSIYSIHKKVVEKNILYSQVLDTIGLRIVLAGVDECYRTMATILKKCPIVSSKIKDYIAIPKSNGYQSIHLTVLYEGHPVEIQIRTREMNAYAQYGLASHVTYKNNNKRRS